VSADDTRREAAQAAQAARLQAARAQRALKRPQRESSFLHFLFRESGRLRRFGRQTHVLEITWLPPWARPAPTLQGFFVQSLQAWAAVLSPRLKGLLEHGWLYLTPYQYNLLSLLRRLSDRILAFDFVRLDYGSRYLIDRLRRIERPFLSLACVEEHLPAIRAAVRQVYDKSRGPEQECAELCELAERLLAPEATLPSLYNAILGLNGVRSRRLTRMADLVDLESITPAMLINARDFDCEPELRRRIDGYLQESVDGLRKLHAEVVEVRRLAGYVRRCDQGGTDSSSLEAFYNAGEGHDLEGDQSDVVLFVTRLCRRFEQLFLPLLDGRVRLAEGTELRLFSRSFFGAELSRLGSVADKLQKGPFHFTDFPVERYLRLHEGRLSVIGSEGEAVRLVEEAVAIVVDVAKTAARVLSLRTPEASAASPASGAAGAIVPPAPLEPIALQGKRIPFAVGAQRLAAPRQLAGLSVADALREVVVVGLSIGLLFQDRFLGLFLARQRRAEIELQGRVRLLQNLMAPEDYRELLASLG